MGTGQGKGRPGRSGPGFPERNPGRGLGPDNARCPEHGGLVGGVIRGTRLTVKGFFISSMRLRMSVYPGQHQTDIVIPARIQGFYLEGFNLYRQFRIGAKNMFNGFQRN